MINVVNQTTNITSTQYDEVIAACRDVFTKKIRDYGTSWRVLRPSSLTDQIFIKAQRIKTIEGASEQRVSDTIEDEYMGIINYAVIALIQLDLDEQAPVHLTEDHALQLYNRHVQTIKKLMEAKNHDYGEAWRSMRTSSFTDLILMKLLRIKQIEENDGKTLISEGVASHYMDMVNYSVFALIQMNN